MYSTVEDIVSPLVLGWSVGGLPASTAGQHSGNNLSRRGARGCARSFVGYQ